MSCASRAWDATFERASECEKKTGCLIWWIGWWIVSGSWVDLGSKRWILAMCMPPALGIVVDRGETTYPFNNTKRGQNVFEPVPWLRRMAISISHKHLFGCSRILTRIRSAVLVDTHLFGCSRILPRVGSAALGSSSLGPGSPSLSHSLILAFSLSHTLSVGAFWSLHGPCFLGGCCPRK